MSWFRGLRADMSLVRPLLLGLVMLLAAAVSGMSSYVAQDVSFAQLSNARLSVAERQWMTARCGKDTPACQAQARRDVITFSRQQQQTAERIGGLQTSAGAVAHGVKSASTGLGLVAIVVFAVQLISMEWRRRTMRHAARAGVVHVAFRRFVLLLCLHILITIAAVIGASAASVAGRSNVPLPTVDAGFPTSIVVGSLAVATLWALVCCVVTLVEKRVAAAAMALLAVLVAFMASTRVSAWAPGTLALSAIDLLEREEFELGYVWIWPQVQFGSEPGAAKVIVDGVPVSVAIGGLAIMCLVVVVFSRRAIVRVEA